MKNRSVLLLFCCVLFSCTQKKPHNEKLKLIVNPAYDKAYDFMLAKQADSAFKYFNEAKDIFLQHKDSLGVAKCLSQMGIIATNSGDYFGGQELSLSGIPFYNEANKKQHVFISANYNNLGLAAQKLEDYNRSILFFDLAIKYSTSIHDTLLYLNNKANTLQEQKNYDKAIQIYQQILAEKRLTKKEYARTLTNLALTQSLQNPEFDPSPFYKEALSIRSALNDIEGLNSSYAHLADYYANINQTIAFDYANKMYAVAQKKRDPEDVLRALRKLTNLSKPNQTKQFFDRFQILLDSLYKVRIKAKNQFALIRYETEKHKADNLILQKDNAQKRFYLIITMIIVVLGSIIALIWYRKRKQKLTLQAKNLVQENSLRTSKKVHDVVANGLYRIMAEIENNEEIDKEAILDKIEELYEKSRDISYDKTPLTNQKFDQKITSLLKSFATSSTKVLIVGNTTALWNRVNTGVQYEIEHILQELMVNMKKHSNATNVAIRFEEKANQITIYYTDNGVGLPKNIIYKNGLTNTGNRIEAIQGKLTFDKELESGLKIYISFPIS